MSRNCPLCGSPSRIEITRVPLTFGGDQWVYQCPKCEMIYSSIPEHVDYDQGSIYALPEALGSGGTEGDRIRLMGVAGAIEARGVPLGASILDVGCAQGGLLAALRSLGYRNTIGLDPSAACVKLALRRGLEAYQGTPESFHGRANGRFDVITLSHVLEHIENPKNFLYDVARLLNPGGVLYVEVPDAARYFHYDAPFLDFNAEHINHFTHETLEKMLEKSRLHVMVSPLEKQIDLPHRGGYPALYTFASPASYSSRAMRDYVLKSQRQLAKMNAYLEHWLRGIEEVAVWGTNSYCANIVSLPIFARIKIAQAVDRNPALHGKTLRSGVKVESPDNIRKDLPIVIGTLMAIDSIQADIRKRQLPNRVISLPLEVYA